jgi:hypothetical protein
MLSPLRGLTGSVTATQNRALLRISQGFKFDSIYQGIMNCRFFVANEMATLTPRWISPSFELQFAIASLKSYNRTSKLAGR